MTKDRRLGRGLAALLGTPLEEDGILDSSAEASLPATRPSSSANNSSALVRSSQQKSSALSSELNVSAPANSRGGVTGGVTGSVPLASRPTKRTHELSSESTANAADDGSMTIRTLEIDVGQIDNNPFQPRRRFNEEEIASLAESIREHQQLQPILVRRVGKRFQLISGERRLRATIHAGLTSIRAEVREADDRLVAELAIVENLQRKDLDAIEKAMSFRRYIDEHKCTQEDLARRLKIDRSTIANLMRLLELPAEIQAWVQNEQLTAGHARTLLPLGDEDQQLDFARRIMEESWTVRETERQVSEQLAVEDGHKLVATAATRGPRKTATPQLAALEQHLRLSLGTKTEIRQSATGRGKIVISFANADEFDRLCALICPQVEKRVA